MSEHTSYYDHELQELVRQLNGGAQPGKSGGPSWRSSEAPERVLRLEEPGPRARIAEPSAELRGLLQDAATRGAADLILVAGSPAVVRVDGRLQRRGSELDAAEVETLVLSSLDARCRQRLLAHRLVDFAFDLPGIGRFRGNVHHERGRLAACYRLLPRQVPKLSELGMPPIVSSLSELPTGLVLVVGPAGSGKTTTLASLLAEAAARRELHAITIEEPVEYLHQSGTSVIEQVEIPVDCPSFAEALRSSLRQSPDVILVGEMRDADTMAAALTAAETGHLVLASVHAFTAPQAVHRVLDVFPAAQQEQIRRQLAVTLSAIVAQRLVPAARKGRRVAVAEVLIASEAVRNLIREGRIHNLGQALATARSEGMIPLEAALAMLVRDGRIDRDVAERHAYYPEELRRLLG